MYSSSIFSYFILGFTVNSSNKYSTRFSLIFSSNCGCIDFHNISIVDVILSINNLFSLIFLFLGFIHTPYPSAFFYFPFYTPILKSTFTSSSSLTTYWFNSFISLHIDPVDLKLARFL